MRPHIYYSRRVSTHIIPTIRAHIHYDMQTYLNIYLLLYICVLIYTTLGVHTLGVHATRDCARCCPADISYADVCWRMLTYADTLGVQATRDCASCCPADISQAPSQAQIWGRAREYAGFYLFILFIFIHSFLHFLCFFIHIYLSSSISSANMRASSRVCRVFFLFIYKHIFI
jgi:hypothetical protein